MTAMRLIEPAPKPSPTDAEHLTALLREARRVLPPSPLRDRIDSAFDMELACLSCGHYLWNHGADGPCAVGEDLELPCPCTAGVGPGRRLAVVREVAERVRQVLGHPNLIFVVYAALLALVVLVRG